MKTKSSLQKIKQIISKYDSFILYKPLSDEVDYNNLSFPLKFFSENIMLPSNKNSNPLLWATKCISKYKNSNPCVLVPGTRFDIYGTRHGRGKGWYDRFLSKIPKKWFRVGITHASKFSLFPISFQEWDEQVDLVITHDGFHWMVYETSARNK
ncbi:MAG: 5-formyltetrahydrofolate cyclo-ligase [Patescibacteria group bacterium]